MPNAEKIKTVEELNGVFLKAKAAILANYQGIDAPELTQLRRHMRAQSVDFRVIKNTLARQAAKDTPFEMLDEQFKGPVSLVVSFEDPVAPAKALAEFAKSGATKSPTVLCGVVEGKMVSSEEVKALADLPSKEVLISTMLSVFNGPTTNFAGVFSSLLRKLVGTLDAVREKKASE
ncbi:MAG: 50S ribosomal protein L10 [Nitrospina sp.]|nr:50S ribosomal protein L10 [Nitrospina sp.]MBT3415086.1 50S ribosomal protein L10 [Nitrospina sp.]MBT3857054.1 50S ribosomal protein L10 [Nitrospina sp.]MBT4103249.1 50S ribosomal protein L10 [Nitrospina sp.]MBT4388296.1 50S ribosomal protein L10 [Nitrospina sp.]